MGVLHSVDDDRFFRKATIGLIVALIVAVVGFAVYYYLDRYHAPKESVSDREMSQVQQMIRNDPSNAALRIRLGDVYLGKSDYSNAISQYQDALKLDDNNFGALGGLGVAYYRSGKLDQSEASFQRILDLTKDSDTAQHAPAMAAIHYLLGKIYGSRGDLQKAEAELETALTITPTDADTLFQYAEVAAQEGKSDDAMKAYQSAIRLVPNFAEAYQGLAKVYDAAGMTTESAYAVGMQDYTKGNFDTAITTLQKVVTSKPDFAEAFFGLGACYDKKGDRDQAIQAYQKAIELQPGYEAAQVALAHLGVPLPASSTPVPGH